MLASYHAYLKVRHAGHGIAKVPAGLAGYRQLIDRHSDTLLRQLGVGKLLIDALEIRKKELEKELSGKNGAWPEVPRKVLAAVDRLRRVRPHNARRLEAALAQRELQATRTLKLLDVHKPYYDAVCKTDPRTLPRRIVAARVGYDDPLTRAVDSRRRAVRNVRLLKGQFLKKPRSSCDLPRGAEDGNPLLALLHRNSS